MFRHISLAAQTVRVGTLMHDDAASRLLRAVKHAVDPDGIMNPGCLFPPYEEMS
jgi:FAD/FMN-containing dehydrogenase